mmetsp:Transcript_70450/g.177617  ORF Transcript_70450/g.177617 Transcript_70450/m.177617 type:complete len:201 (+) Transcript_70450:146-748(+)
MVWQPRSARTPSGPAMSSCAQRLRPRFARSGRMQRRWTARGSSGRLTPATRATSPSRAAPHGLHASCRTRGGHRGIGRRLWGSRPTMRRSRPRSSQLSLRTSSRSRRVALSLCGRQRRALLMVLGLGKTCSFGSTSVASRKGTHSSKSISPDLRTSSNAATAWWFCSRGSTSRGSGASTSGRHSWSITPRRTFKSAWTTF